MKNMQLTQDNFSNQMKQSEFNRAKDTVWYIKSLPDNREDHSQID